MSAYWFGCSICPAGCPLCIKSEGCDCPSHRAPEKGEIVTATIWKFPIAITDEQKITMPEGARLLHAGLDPTGLPCVWAVVDPLAVKIEATVLVCGTGNPLRAVGRGTFHLGSFNQGPFMWHVFMERQ